MPNDVISLTCPGCGARVSTAQKVCDWCHAPIILSSFRDIRDMALPSINKCVNAYQKALSEHPDNNDLNKSAALCFLKLKLYDMAIPAFQKALKDNYTDPELYIDEAICLLRGKKAFLAKRADIDKAIELIEAANGIDPKGIYYYFMAYIKYDFFERKSLNTSPNYQECLLMAKEQGVSDEDINDLFATLGVSLPAF